MCLMSLSVGAGGLHVEHCVPNDNHKAFFNITKRIPENLIHLEQKKLVLGIATARDVLRHFVRNETKLPEFTVSS
jgi:hypothetical protein